LVGNGIRSPKLSRQTLGGICSHRLRLRRRRKAFSKGNAGIIRAITTYNTNFYQPLQEKPLLISRNSTLADLKRKAFPVFMLHSDIRIWLKIPRPQAPKSRFGEGMRDITSLVAYAVTAPDDSLFSSWLCLADFDDDCTFVSVVVESFLGEATALDVLLEIKLSVSSQMSIRTSDFPRQHLLSAWRQKYEKNEFFFSI